MKRRAFIMGLCVAASAGLSDALAQRNLRTVGIWWSPLQVGEILPRYKARLAELGWTEGRNVQFQIRAWDGDTGRMRLQADELVAAHPDVIVAVSNPAVAILKPVGGNVPIVFGMVADPAGSGFIDNLARPGGNITGFTNFEASMGGKWLELLREAVPTISRVLVLMHPETAAHKEFFRAIESLAGPLKIEVMAGGIHNSAEVERALADFAANGNGGGVIALPHAITEDNRDLIIRLATARLMPSIFAFESHAYAGALATYGIDRSDTILQTADYVDRILRGTKPADLPVQAAQKFELVVNLKTAKALGLTISPNLLGRADKVIE
jgi:putative ABC transport system substrate-binding protein